MSNARRLTTSRGINRKARGIVAKEIDLLPAEHRILRSLLPRGHNVCLEAAGLGSLHCSAERKEQDRPDGSEEQHVAPHAAEGNHKRTHFLVDAEHVQHARPHEEQAGGIVDPSLLQPLAVGSRKLLREPQPERGAGGQLDRVPAVGKIGMPALEEQLEDLIHVRRGSRPANQNLRPGQTVRGQRVRVVVDEQGREQRVVEELLQGVDHENGHWRTREQPHLLYPTHHLDVLACIAVVVGQVDTRRPSLVLALQRQPQVPLADRRVCVGVRFHLPLPFVMSRRDLQHTGQHQHDARGETVQQRRCRERAVSKARHVRTRSPLGSGQELARLQRAEVDGRRPDSGPGGRRTERRGGR
eukprot:3934002-Rhodomonas_salina.2